MRKATSDVEFRSSRDDCDCTGEFLVRQAETVSQFGTRTSTFSEPSETLFKAHEEY